MKVAVVSVGSFDTQYSDYHIIRDIVTGLLKGGDQVTLIEKQYLEEPLFPLQFKEYLGNELHVISIPFEKKNKADLKTRYLADLSYYRRVCRIMKKDKPDKIFLQSNNTAFFTVFYAKHLLKRPLLYNEQDIFPENAYFAGIISEKSIIYKVAHMLQKYAYKNATALSTISEDMKSTICGRYGIKADKVQVIHNWGHEELKAHSEEENRFLKRYPKRKGEFRVVYAGNLGKMQNVELILRTALLMQDEEDITFFIIGSGVLEEELKTYADSNKATNVVFVDMQPPEEVADLYAAADINVIPLKKKLIFAALPSKTADCLIAGKPIITCVDEESSFAELLEGFGIQNAGADDPDRLKEIILSIKNGRKEAREDLLWEQHFSAEKSVNEHCRGIREMEIS